MSLTKRLLGKAKYLHRSPHSNSMHKTCTNAGQENNPSMESEYKVPSLVEDLIAVGRGRVIVSFNYVTPDRLIIL